MRTLYALPLAVALTVCYATGTAQEIKRPFRTQTFNALSESTSKYSPQIDNKFVARPHRPENPWEVSERQDPPNSLVAGEIRNVPRGVLGPSFPAISATGWTPPDPDLAVGPNQIIAVVNSSVAFFNKDGTPTFQQTAENFFSGLGAGSFIFDPKCVYDRVHQRFVIVFPERDTSPQVSKVLIAISDDNNPAGVWHKYRIEARMTISGTNYWLDYPGFGYNKDAVVVSGNMFGFGSGFAGVQYIVIPTAPILSGGTATVRYLFDEDAGSVQIAEVVDPTMDRIFGASRGGTSSLNIYAISNLTTPSPLLQGASVAVPANTRPQMDAPSTNGNTLDSIDGRLFNAVWRPGRLVASHTIQDGSLLKVRWYEVNTNSWPVSGSPTLSMSGNISGAGSTHHHMNAVNTNSLGDISAIFTRSSTTVTADIMYAGRMAADPIGTMGTPVNLEGSAGNNYGSGRWGDYFGVDVDPVDDVTFWGIAMGVAADNNWRTSIFSWTISVPGTVVAPNLVTMERGSIFAGGVPELAQSDDQRLQLRPGIVLANSEAPIRAKISGVSPVLAPSVIRLTVESQASSANINQKIEMLVQETGVWEELDSRAATVNTDGSVQLLINSNAGRFVDAAGNVAARLSYKVTAPIFSLPWTARVDRCVWTVQP
ncbi:MAG: hypothetical protein M3R13_05445 [Armatimonadota bacterium]|nr:hypothetical protein [Armatimonadota bacterium]